MQSVKVDRVIEKLIKNYFPFNTLSKKRAYEVANLVRFIEMQPGEIYQIVGGIGNDCIFILEGKMELVQHGVVRTVVGSKETRNRPLSLPKAPETSTLFARDQSIICHADREMLDQLISWDEIVQSSEKGDSILRGRLELVSNSHVFRRLPMECVEEAFRRMHKMEVKAGQEIITHGEDADAYYIIEKGHAEAFQMDIYEDILVKVAVLNPGDAFGDEIVISGRKRSESVRMIEDGELLVLHDKDFEELIGKEMVKTVNAQVAKSMIDTGYKVLDVRYPEEFEDMYIPDSILIPLHELRNRFDELEHKEKYIVYCHSGNRSAVAALMLSQKNYDVYSMDGGIRDWPFDTNSLY